MPAVDTQAVLSFIRVHGPVLPVQVARQINQNSMMAGAVLSELVSSGKLKVSKLKVGGSPLYYPPGQENRLMSFISHLDPKDRQSYELLRQQGVLQDSALDPLTRVSLRGLRDFAVPISVSRDGRQETFWRWYLLSDSQAAAQIEQHNQAGPVRLTEAAHPPIAASPPPDPFTVQAPDASTPLPSDSNLISGSEYEDDLLSSSPSRLVEKGVPTPASPLSHEKSVTARQSKLMEQAPVPQAPGLVAGVPDAVREPVLQDAFFQRVAGFFSEKSMGIASPVCVRKGREFECLVSMPCSVGTVTFFCKALNKKRVSDADLSNAFVQSQWHHLPGLLIIDGQLTKKAQEIMNTKLKGLTVSSMGAR